MMSDYDTDDCGGLFWSPVLSDTSAPENSYENI